MLALAFGIYVHVKKGFNMRLWFVQSLSILFCLSSICTAESFVLKKKKKKQPSMSTLKEEYLNEVSETIRRVPKLHAQLARLQEEQIQELAAILADEISLSKNELQNRIEKAHELNVYLREDVSKSLGNTILVVADAK